MKNKLLLLLSRGLRQFVSQNEANGRFLVVSSTGLGDSLWATPALQSLRNCFPDSYIALLTTETGEQVFRNHPSVNEMIVFKDPLFWKILPLWQQLKKLKIGTVLNFHSSQRAMLPLCASIGAKQIIGTREINKGFDSLLTYPLHNLQQHQIIRRLEIVEAAGAKRCTETLSFYLTPEEILAAPKLSPGRWIALHPGSKDGFKRWPAKHFALVGRRLQQMGYQILITGSSDERDLMNHVAAHIPGAEISNPKLSIREFGALLTQLSLLISNDTGPAHLGLALGIPVITLFCPTNPTLCGPHIAPNGTSVAKPPACEPCLKRKCRSPFCLLQIGPEDVVNSARNVLKI